jgi:hypothetical protein
VKHITAEPLSDLARATLAELEASGWRSDYSPTCGAWRMVNSANKWSTNLYYDPAKAIEAAESVTRRAAVVLAERARLRRELRACFEVTT